MITYVKFRDAVQLPSIKGRPQQSMATSLASGQYIITQAGQYGVVRVAAADPAPSPTGDPVIVPAANVVFMREQADQPQPQGQQQKR